MPTALRILRRKEIQTITGLSRSAIYKKMADGDFPRVVNLGARSVGWVESEVLFWLESKVAARSQIGVRASSQ